jgi:hypothetical protein
VCTKPESFHTEGKQDSKGGMGIAFHMKERPRCQIGKSNLDEAEIFRDAGVK